MLQTRLSDQVSCCAPIECGLNFCGGRASPGWRLIIKAETPEHQR